MDVKNEKEKTFGQILIDICKSEDITLISVPIPKPTMQTFNEKMKGHTGAAMKDACIGDMIFYQDKLGKWEKRYTIAHEIAHHLFGHLEPSCTFSTEQKEFEARIFGVVMTALAMYKEFDSPP